MTRQADLLAPSIDPATKKLAIRKVSASNDGGTQTIVKVRGFAPVIIDEPDTLGGTNTGPSPLEMQLVSLAGCDGVIIHGVAKAMGFSYTGVDFECSGQVDVRGPKGVPGIRPYFEAVNLKITLHTDESDARIAMLQKNVEFRCPVMNLMRAADVRLNVEWVVAPAKRAPA